LRTASSSVSAHCFSNTCSGAQVSAGSRV
jgi:hypothetical protein